jgi:Fic-DOC domain mobile mystery protein B
VSDVFAQPDDAATPLTDDEKRDLIPIHIAHRRDLNAAEQQNIVRGQAWALRRRRRHRDVLNERFVRDLHAQMFGDVWRWAGNFRLSARNIGIDHWEIPVVLRMLLDDARTWVANNVYPRDEIAVRFHHRLVQIHAFPNGNGRHARMIADLLVLQLGGERFSWGSASLRDPGETRATYIDALRAADAHDIGPLLAFARS